MHRDDHEISDSVNLVGAEEIDPKTEEERQAFAQLKQDAIQVELLVAQSVLGQFSAVAAMAGLGAFLGCSGRWPCWLCQ